MFDTKSRLMAAAIGAAFALPIAAQAQTNVAVYGKLYPDITHVNVSGALPAGAGASTLGPTGKGMGNSTGVASNWLDGKPTAGQDISTVALGISHSF